MQRLIFAFLLLVPLFAQQNSITVTVARQATGHIRDQRAFRTAQSNSGACLYKTLFADAKRQAQRIAAAAGLRVGQLTAMSDDAPGLVVPVALMRAGDFVGYLGSYYGPQRYSCSLSVRFLLEL